MIGVYGLLSLLMMLTGIVIVNDMFFCTGFLAVVVIVATEKLIKVIKESKNA